MASSHEHDKPKYSADVDLILEKGTKLYSSICANNGHDGSNYLLITELPKTVVIEERTIKLTLCDPLSGMLSHNSNDAEALTFCLQSALEKSFQESITCFFTVGNAPGYTIGIILVKELVFSIIDSHSRDSHGKCVENGKAVILEVRTLKNLELYIREMSGSLSVQDMPFEVIPAHITTCSSTTNRYCLQCIYMSVN